MPRLLRNSSPSWAPSLPSAGCSTPRRGSQGAMPWWCSATASGTDGSAVTHRCSDGGSSWMVLRTASSECCLRASGTPSRSTSTKPRSSGSRWPSRPARCPAAAASCARSAASRRGSHWTRRRPRWMGPHGSSSGSTRPTTKGSACGSSPSTSRWWARSGPSCGSPSRRRSWSCSSPAPTSRACCWLLPSAARGRPRCAPPSAPAVDASRSRSFSTPCC